MSTCGGSGEPMCEELLVRLSLGGDRDLDLDKFQSGSGATVPTAFVGSMGTEVEDWGESVSPLLLLAIAGGGKDIAPFSL